MKHATVRKLIAKIEGDAVLDFRLQNGRIDDVAIRFEGMRGIESIMTGRAVLDALVITPRTCGICNHAHLLAAVDAIEKGCEAAGVEIALSSKARQIRNFTLACELMQNHLKWFYLVMMPRIEKFLDASNGDGYMLKAAYGANKITKALALFGGQWPHSGYAVPGGVTCDPTHIEVMQAISLLDETIRFMEHALIGVDTETFLSFESVTQLYRIGGDLGRCVGLLTSSRLGEIGRSADRFLVLASSPLSDPAKSIATKTAGVDTRYVQEQAVPGMYAKSVRYKGRTYETGPLARAMAGKVPMVRALHKRYKDAFVTRVFARVHEAIRSAYQAKKLLETIRLDEPSCIKMPELETLSFVSAGTVEAARGSLLHRVRVKQGFVERYDIVTPTQWNLIDDGSREGIALQAMIGCRNIEEAELVFRAFDVCAVCTTQ